MHGKQGVEVVDEDVGDGPEVADVAARVAAGVVGRPLLGAQPGREQRHHHGPYAHYEHGGEEDPAETLGRRQAVEDQRHGQLDQAGRDVDAQLVGEVKLHDPR